MLCVSGTCGVTVVCVCRDMRDRVCQWDMRGRGRLHVGGTCYGVAVRVRVCVFVCVCRTEAAAGRLAIGPRLRMSLFLAALFLWGLEFSPIWLCGPACGRPFVWPMVWPSVRPSLRPRVRLSLFVAQGVAVPLCGSVCGRLSHAECLAVWLSVCGDTECGYLFFLFFFPLSVSACMGKSAVIFLPVIRECSHLSVCLAESVSAFRLMG